MTDDTSLRDLLYDLEPQDPVSLAAQCSREVRDVIGEMRKRSLVFDACAPPLGSDHWWFRLTSDARAERCMELTGKMPARPRRAMTRTQGTDRLSLALILLERRHEQHSGGSTAEWLAGQVGGFVGDLAEAMANDHRFARVAAGTTVYWWSAEAKEASDAGVA